MKALGAYLAAAVARSLTMPALILNKSSRVMPGLRGTPAGMTTKERMRAVISAMYVGRCARSLFDVLVSSAPSDIRG
ncbi:hypothetical protein BC937DRAFT_92681 [Endogone sp. FLAS-F59071]|nr:hypothetical protein BC937DRAFT_92681 [Endogone sp. FLAS-F59071]|eukprot:RUS15263.1 hypothetical protein BC937DRAFT_92681 [Endogone sp. FLAS-F59071]